VTTRIGVDVGGTKTHILTERDNRITANRLIPTSEWQIGELMDSYDNARRLIAMIGVVERGSGLVVGAHGLDNEHQVRTFDSWLRELHEGPLQVLNDVELVAAAAGSKPAVSVIAGTGSKVVGRNTSGEVVAAGGHGYLIDDPGSAPAISRDAVRAVVAAADSGLPEDDLGRALRRELSASDDAALGAAFSAAVGATRWGALAPTVFQCAEAGSDLARTVIQRGGRELAWQVQAVLSRGALAELVVCAGGVMTHQPLLLNALVDGLTELGVELPVALLSTPPAFGALEYARRLAPEVSLTRGHA
jgi:glucosamine kinase